MGSAAAPLNAVRAIGRLDVGGPWIGFGYRAGASRIVVEVVDAMRDASADQDLVLALAIAYFAEALDDAPPDLEATQSDMSALVRHVMGAEADPARHALLGEAMDAIDDGLAGDAVAEKLQAARSARDGTVDPIELLSMRAQEIAAGG
ncbi:MAG: hypothetical protein WD402_01725 [Chloroflexota bacterium]